MGDITPIMEEVMLIILVGGLSFLLASWLCQFKARNYLTPKIYMILCVVGIIGNILGFLRIGLENGTVAEPTIGSLLFGIGGVAGYSYGRYRQSNGKKQY